MYEGKFRDFMVGWLADHLERTVMTREEIAALYDIVAEAETDEAALAEVRQVLGQTVVRKLVTLSRQWRDPTIDTAREMIEALRDRVQEDDHDRPDFYYFFLNPFKQGCVPEGYAENLEREIIWMFRTLYAAASAGALAPYGWEVEVVVEPSYEDASYIVVLAHQQAENQHRAFLMDQWSKAWHVRFANLHELAQALLTIRQKVEQSVGEAVLGYRLIKTITDVMGHAVDTPSEPVSKAPARVTIEVHGGVATVIDKSPGIEVEIIDFDTGLAQL